MKLAPVALVFATDPETAVESAALSARTTHGAPEAADTSRFLAALLVGALNGTDAPVLLRRGESAAVAWPT